MGIPLIGGILDTVGKLAGKFIKDKDKQMEFEHEFKTALLQLDFGQMEINKEEAKHASIFVSGWRPFVGWTCGGGLFLTSYYSLY